jgi:Uma2 family endonuclease
LARIADRLTFDDLEAIPEERAGDRHELIDGELVVTPSCTLQHQLVLGDVIFSLDTLVRNANLGTILPGPIGVRFTPDNVLIPDMIYVVRGRQHVIGPKVVDAPPDLIVEVLSDETRKRDVKVKRDLYARFGVQEYWIIDPEARTVSVLGLVGAGFEPIPLTEDRVIQSWILPELRLTVEAVFEGLNELETYRAARKSHGDNSGKIYL